MIVNCGQCGTDEYVEYDPGLGVAICSGPVHPVPRMWEPRKPGQPGTAASDHKSDAIAAQLGLYDDLIDFVIPGEWADTMVIEHRYGTAHPDNYKWMIDRWGHVAMGPRRYSVTAFIGSTLGALSTWTAITYQPGRGTGFFSYNRTIGTWTIEPVPSETTLMSWERFAEEEGFSPNGWPLLGYPGTDGTG